MFLKPVMEPIKELVSESIEEPVNEPTEVPTKAPVRKFKSIDSYMPSKWNILRTAEGIYAHNGTTGEEFTGTVAEFNAILRG